MRIHLLFITRNMYRFLGYTSIAGLLLTGCVAKKAQQANSGVQQNATILTMADPLTPSANWNLVWEDEFDGTSIDTSKWSRIPKGTSDWNRHMSTRDDCYEVSAGLLHLKGIVNTDSSTDRRPFLTGGIWSQHKLAFQYGRVEIRAKLGMSTGAWPAIWLLAETDKYGAYPRNGEIDIMEHLNFDTIAYQTTHSYYTLVLKKDKEPPHGGTAPINNQDFNVYGLEWYPDKLVFFVNGRQSFVYPRVAGVDKTQWPYDQPFYILIDQQLGGNWVGPVNTAQLPVDMQIDWVRIYQ
ncbi:MAG TPA: glycoside hydrolase family 16 protein [Flavihumibacter sp.]|nr:glycoside hydrolase family 16 protein [Flavihumibacter sp.]